MGDDHHQVIKQLFQDAADLEVDRRECFLVERCGGDESLRREVEALLGASDHVGLRFLEGMPPSPLEMPLPERIGRYRIVRRIGEGGMGAVFEAVQDNPRRCVALKLLKAGLFSAGSTRRFEYEAQVLATLNHPGIAQVYEAGTEVISGVAIPYFAMELIAEATPINVYVRRADLDIRRRATLFAEVCDAVQHGHERGVIHRDLKPSNILVDRVGRPRIIDFGIARSTAESTFETLSRTGQIVGTLAYMSPEQCSGDSRDIDVRSDVYSLGIVLYELLCDRLPYDVGGADVLTAARIIRGREPVRPSSVRPFVRGDLEIIVLKALAKDRARRYESAGALARDLRRSLCNEPIDARRDSAWYVLRKTASRYRMPLVAASAIVLLLAASSAVSWSLMVRARASEHAAQDNLRESLLSQAAARRQNIAQGRRSEALDALTRAAAIRPGIDLRNEAIAAMAVRDLRTTFPPLPQGLDRVGFSRDLTYCAASDSAGGVRIFHLPDGVEASQVPPPSDARVQLLAYYCDSRRFARLFDRPRAPRRFELWRIPDTDLMLAIDDVPDRASFDVSADGRTLAIGRSDRAIHLYDMETCAPTRRIELDREPSYVRFDPAGKRLARFHARDVQASVFDLERGTSTRILPGTDVSFELEWSTDGKLIAAAAGDSIHIWDVERDREAAVLTAHDSTVCNLAFLDNDRLLASSGWDGVFNIWDLATSRPILRPAMSVCSYRASDGLLGGLTSRDGRPVVTLGQMQHQDAHCVLTSEVGSSASRGLNGALHPGGRVAVIAVAGGGDGAALQFFDIVGRCPIGRIASTRPYWVRFDSSGSWLFNGDADGIVRWPVHIGGTTVRVGPPQRLTDDVPDRFAISAQGDRLAYVTPATPLLKILDLGSPHRLRTILSMLPVRLVALSPDGRWAALNAWSSPGGEVWDLDMAKVVARPEIGENATLTFSDDGRWLVIHQRSEISLIRAGRWDEVRRGALPIGGHVSFSRDGRKLIGFDERGVIHMIDLERLVEIAAFDPPEPSGIVGAELSDDGAMLAAFTFRGGYLQCWDLRRVRATLASMGLDWDEPPFPPAALTEPSDSIRLEVELGKLTPKQLETPLSSGSTK